MTATEIVDRMFSRDAFSQWLGIERLELGAGHCRLRMVVRPEMCNGFGIAHGGIAFSLADSALAFASNGHGRHAVSIDTGIRLLAPVRAGETLTAAATEEHLSHRIGHYRVEVTKANGEPVALFTGTVYRKSAVWE